MKYPDSEDPILSLYFRPGLHKKEEIKKMAVLLANWVENLPALMVDGMLDVLYSRYEAARKIRDTHEEQKAFMRQNR